MSDDDLLALSRSRLLALSLEEMRAVRDHFAGPPRPRRPREATDVELEMIAQTWSEHCKHKIFAASITYREGGREEIIDSLFRTYIRSTTERIAGDRPFLRSVFHDNSGVIQVDEETLLAFKVETHNSPSALDPYGGAITGIVGVNRDILGTGQAARPIFNTNVLCFADPSTPPADVPAGLLPPARVMEGVHHGIVDGGNQSGIPVVAGAFLFDDSYIGKPLVFCGTGGLLPAELNGRPGWVKSVSPGDLAVMVGGRIGKDGIHGATFSSLALDEASPTSAVQIGDPIIQKRMTDLLMEARDLGLFAGLTDNGAGGLSSSLGEMALEPGGVRIHLDKCPLKYTGLAPWEILLSESQERMSLAVRPAKIGELLSLAKRRGVEATVIGEFTDSGFVEVFHEGRQVARVACAFLADGVPRMHLEAAWDPAPRPTAPRQGRGLAADLLALLADPNIASKEELVRQYDHEVQGRSVIKPFCGAREDAPTDGAVLRLRPGSFRGITVTHGICPRYGDHDAWRMAMCAVDEALRAHVALRRRPRPGRGARQLLLARPRRCRPSNPDGPRKLAQLVRACRGLAEACLAYSLPLISGKDSMKNDAFAGGRKISIRPTLLISLAGIIEDVRRAVSTDFKAAGRPGLRARGHARGARRQRLRAPGRLRCSARRRRSRPGRPPPRTGRCTPRCAQGLVRLLPRPVRRRPGRGAVRVGPRRRPRGRDRPGRPPGRDAARRAARGRPASLLRDAVALSRDGAPGGRRRLRGAARRLPARRGRRGERAAARADPQRRRRAARRRRRGPARGLAREDAVSGSPVRVCVLQGLGINADEELIEAFRAVGAEPAGVHVTDVVDRAVRLADFAHPRPSRRLFLRRPPRLRAGPGDAPAAPPRRRAGGVRPGRPPRDRHLQRLPGARQGRAPARPRGDARSRRPRWSPTTRARSRTAGSRSAFRGRPASGPAASSRSELPVRHGEGKLITADPRTLDALERRRPASPRSTCRGADRAAAAYPDNPNGSIGDIAGICDASGRVFGLMPHPEAFQHAENHPRWTRESVSAAGGLAIFRAGVSFAAGAGHRPGAVRWPNAALPAAGLKSDRHLDRTAGQPSSSSMSAPCFSAAR